ncbi:MAG: hydrolase [Bacteroidetes bacterium GWF2_33_16]|nr:MAG: hydrolase [Bacteroidetes bacterium GWE2_32_14]OFY08719.1 MAG: hydrolase [Bacteroidetes bacterium GWF2_33_16]
MNRDQAEELLKSYITNEKMLYHCYSSEAVLRALAKRLGQNEKKWALAGLLHDIDSEITNGDSKRHALEAADILRKHGIDEEIIDAIKMHNEHATGLERTTQFQYALAAGETITGLIYATALVYPDRKIKDVQTKSVTKRMNQTAFAASVNRTTIMECEKIGIPLYEFAEISINAMKEIAEKIGL